MADLGLTRLRIAVVGAIGLVLALAASDIFDQTVWGLLVAPVLPALAAILLCTRSGPVRLVGAVVAVIGAVAVVVALWEGSAGDVVDAFTSGAQRLISTEWPSPTRPDLIGTTAVGLALSVAVAAELARSQRWHLLPLLPLLVEYVIIIATSAPGGVQLGWLIPLGLLSIVLATLRPGATLRERAVLLRGERRLVPVLIVTGVIAIAVSIPLSLTARADPRTYDAPDRTASILEPIEAMLAIQDLDPPQEMHRIDGGGETLPTRWRTAALEEYDGRRWAPAITIRPLGRTLGVAGAETLQVDIEFLDDDLTMIPLAGSPVTVDALIQTDLERTVVRLDETLAPGEAVAVRTNLPPARASITSDDVGLRPVDETTSGLTDFAEDLAGEGDVLQQLETIEQRMRDNFALDSSAPGGGLQRALIERFLRETQRGNAEQFATAFVLLARSLGVDARVATGFVSDTSEDGRTVLSSDDVAIWPEVRVGEDEWIAFDPVPTEEVTDAIPPPEEPAEQSPAAPQPPIEPPSDQDDEVRDEEEQDEVTSSGGFRPATWVWIASGSLLAIVVPLIIAVWVILAMKRRRRERRLGAKSPIDRVRGAWALATDALVDAGQRFTPASTDTEIAGQGSMMVADADLQIHRLATLASQATFGTMSHPEVRAAEALSYLEDVEFALAEDATTAQRMRWRLSLRSLRRRTRSPVS